MSANEVEFSFDPAAPAATLAVLNNVTVEFPAYPDFPTGSIDRLEITPQRIVLENATITGGSYRLSPEPASSAAASPAAQSPTAEAQVSTAASLVPGAFDYQDYRLANGLSLINRGPSINNAGQVAYSAILPDTGRIIVAVEADGNVPKDKFGAVLPTIAGSDRVQINDQGLVVSSDGSFLNGYRPLEEDEDDRDAFAAVAGANRSFRPGAAVNNGGEIAVIAATGGTYRLQRGRGDDEDFNVASSAILPGDGQAANRRRRNHFYPYDGRQFGHDLDVAAEFFHARTGRDE